MTRLFVAFDLRMALAVVGALLIAPLCASSAPSLADALDNSAVVWQTGGDQVWAGQTNVTHDAVDAAQSGLIADEEESWIQMSVLGPAPLSFWWKVSSESGFDHFSFSIDNVEQVTISGEKDWEQRSFDLPPGSHVLKWRYAKDETQSDGSDRAWLDQVNYVPPVISPPEILTHPSNQTVVVGATVSFRVMAIGVPEPTYRWRFNQNFISGQTNAILTLTNVATNQSGPYSVVVSNPEGTVTSDPALLTVTPIQQALDALELPWSIGGHAPWLAQTSVTHDGIDAAVSGSITNSEQSWVETTVNGPGLLTFWWKVSSEGFYDGLHFLTNGVPILSLSGEAEWERQTIFLSPGSMTLRWRYSKDPSITMGEDRGWLDQVTYVSNRPPSNVSMNLSAPIINESESVTLNGSFTDPDPSDAHPLVIDWGDGSPPMTNYLPAGVLSFGITHRYHDDNPPGTAWDTNVIAVAVSDPFETAIANVSLRVNNLQPVLRNLSLTTPIFSNGTARLTGAVNDPGLLDTTRLSVDWGDNSPIAVFDYPPGTNLFNLHHSYSGANITLPITLMLEDDDGAITSVTTNLVIGGIVAQPRLFSVYTNGNVHLWLEGTAEAHYRIEASEDLENWTTVAFATPTSTAVEFNDPEQALHKTRFYRATWDSQSVGSQSSN
jgi:hypothetical protein